MYIYFQKLYNQFLNWLLALPLWLDLLLLSVLAGVFYHFALTILPWLSNTFIPLIQSLSRSFKKVFRQNKDFISLKEKNPRLFSFIYARLDTSRFSGLSLTFFLLIFLYIVALFGGVVEDLITRDSIVKIDQIVNQWSVSKRTYFFNNFFWALTQLGSIQVITFLVAFFTLFLYFSNRYYYLLGLYIGIIGSLILTFAGKYAFARERPLDALYHESLFSFPSGHATIAVSFFGFVLYTFFRENPNLNIKLKLFFTALILIFLIGMSRIYLGVHYLSDVWAGYLVGAIWLVIGVALSEYQKSSQRVQKINLKQDYLLTSLIGTAASIFYIMYLFWHPLKSTTF
jgi:undecaprenyl-diphosphatase